MALHKHTDLDELFRPQRAEDLVGIEIVFQKDGRGFERGTYYTPEFGYRSFSRCDRGEVIDWQYYNGRNMPPGLYLTVQSDAFNRPVRIHESQFVAYSFEVEAMASYETIAS